MIAGAEPSDPERLAARVEGKALQAPGAGLPVVADGEVAQHLEAVALDLHDGYISAARPCRTAL